MEALPEVIERFITKHMRRILILLFTMLIGMAIAMNRPAHAQTKKPAAATATPQAAAKGPVPLVFGSVTSTTDTGIAIIPDAASSTTDSSAKSFTIATTTRIEAPGITTIKGKPTVKDIAKGDAVAVASSDQSTASLITIAAKGTLTPTRSRVFFGIVSSREATSSGTILSLKHPKDDTFAKALVSTQTTITAKGIDKPTIDDIKASDKVAVSGADDAKEILQAKRLFLLPGRARGLLDRLASPSASPSKGALPTAASKASANPKGSPAASTKSY